MPSSGVDSILLLEVPVAVQIAARAMPVAEVISWVPGSIVELSKNCEDELELMVNNKTIGTGVAVKVGENFGIRVEFVGDVRERFEIARSGIISGS